MTDENQQFQQMLLAMVTYDPKAKDSRQQAENFFNQQMENAPENTIIFLLQALQTSSDKNVRTVACVTLRKYIGNDEKKQGKWNLINPQNQAGVKNGLLQALTEEANSHVRTQISEVVSKLASHVLKDPSAWPELLPLLFKMVQSDNPSFRECALLMFQQMSITLGEQLRAHNHLLKDIFANGLKDDNLKVKIAAIGAIANFLDCLKESQERVAFQQLIPGMLSVISSCLNAEDEEAAREAIELFIVLVELDPLFLKPSLSEICSAMMTISNASTLEPDTRHLALEFLLALAESRPQLARKAPNFLENLLPILLTMMMKVPDDPNWNEQERENESDDEEDDEDVDIGNESLDRISLAMKGKNLVPVLFGIISNMLGNGDWKQRYTALMAISIIGEGCYSALAPVLGEVVKKILVFSNDPHPRVRWAFCNAIGQMSTDFGPQFQNQFSAEVVPSLINLMDDTANPRVQSHSASAIINFCEHATKDQLKPYLNDLMNKFGLLMSSGKKIVIEQSITAIAAVADCAEEHFLPYYSKVMPILKGVLHNAKGHDYRKMKGKAMECISLIGTAVGKEQFLPDAKEVMDVMMQTQQEGLADDDPQTTFLLQSWARVAKCLGQDFVPYLPFVMPPLLKSAQVRPDTSKIQGAESLTEDEAWEMVPALEQKLGGATASLEEKATACNMLYSYALELKEGFFPYVSETAKILVPLLKFFWHDGVRSAAITSMPHLLQSAKDYLSKSEPNNTVSYLRQLFNFMHPAFLEAMVLEDDLETLLVMFESFKQCINIAGPGCLEQDKLENAIKTSKELFIQIKNRREDRQKGKHDEDFDDEENDRVEEQAETDLDVLTQLAEFIGHHVKAHPETVQQWSELLPYFSALVDPRSEAIDRQVGLCVFCDFVEFGGEASLPYFDTFLPHCVNYLTDSDAGVRQAAVYGIGCCAQVGGNSFAPLVPDVLSKIVQKIQEPDSRTEENIYCTENAISAVGKIAMFQGHTLGQEGAAQAIQFFVDSLPVTKDLIEAKVTYARLCEFIEKNNPYIFGNDYANLAKFLNIFANLISTELIDDSIQSRIVTILSALKNQIPEKFQSAFSGLSQEEQQKLVSLNF